MNEEQQSQIQGIPPSPLPTNFDVGVHEFADGRKVIRLAVSTPAGITVVFMVPEAGKQLADALIDTAARCGSGLTIAHVVPPAPPINFPNGHQGR